MNASGIRLIERRNSRHRHRRGGSRPAAKLVKVAESGLSAVNRRPKRTPYRRPKEALTQF